MQALCPNMPGRPADAEGPVFSEPWQAQAFAMTVSLHERGIFTWVEWAAALSAEIVRAQSAGDPDDGNTYYHHWLGALERLLCEKGLSNPVDLARGAEAWHRAAHRTPHGQALALQPEDWA